MKRTQLLIILLVTAVLFAILFPISSRINFYQNDDWIYYRTVKDFMHGYFIINGYIETSFYTQGFLGLGFAKLFGLQHLPVLTLIFSVLNFGIFTLILNKFYVKKTLDAILIGLIFFLSPLHIYATLGFMTDNYFLFFALVAIYLMEEFLHTKKQIYLIPFFVVILLGFFVRQLEIAVPVTLVAYLFITKEFKQALKVGIPTAILLIYYFFFYGKTEAMAQNQNFVISNLLDFQYTFDTIYVSLFYAVCFILPITIFLPFYNREKLKRPVYIVLFIAAVIGVYFAITFFYKPTRFYMPEMFYLKNTVTKTGFFTSESLGKHATIIGDNTLYFYWRLITNITLAITIVCLLLTKKKLLNYYTVFGVLYIGLMCVMQDLYDRYFLILIPVIILAIINASSQFKLNWWIRTVFIVFIATMTFYLYNISMDFLLTNNSVWQKSNDLVVTTNVKPTLIGAGSGWQRTYFNPTARYKYVFMFKSLPETPSMQITFQPYDSYNIWYPFDFYSSHNIYVYKRRL